ncbi:hypothetical protein B0T21DRAFT_408121 [Apiosordaria backusii]|uniref:Cryptic loci regulator 2 N-terminal domain-containing protein n=1 Tax=Apiosordaria backusii TaxID=314023 RepID=A0AA40K483_9PEZI|nr:hypothetical protein B0T21DRAFT_408121 [Apiosordaria backusii]
MASSASKDDSSAEYWSLTIARSDGQGYTDLDQNPLDLNEDSDVTQLERWEVIIGGHLAMQLAPKEDKRQFKLAEFPKGYELRVAIRKDQARDYYLYGHPASAKSIYRTPGEFASHALWLASGSTDNSQCPCDLCARYVEGQQKRAEAIAAWESNPASHAAAVHYSTPPRSQPASVQPEQQAQQTQQSRPQQQQQIQQRQQQQLQMFPGTTGFSNVFRVGEMVWYRYSAWRLGVIFSIAARPGTQPGAPDTGYDFRIAPLGHATLQQEIIIKDAPSMRPFLTFSVPDSPAHIKGKPFDEVDWLALSESERRGKDPAQHAQALQGVGLEASKLAARTINDCFSFFNKIHDEPTPDNLFRLQCFQGVYYGAEMIVVNDPIRVQLGLPADGSQQHPAEPPVPTSGIMHVQQIQYLISLAQPNQRPVLRFQGRLLRPIRTLADNPPPGAIPPETLGPVFTEELVSRNMLEKNKSMRWFWVIISPRTLQPAAAGEDLKNLTTTKLEGDVLGRFYVSAKIMQLVNMDLYKQWVERGAVDEPPSYLNNRGASGNLGQIQRRPTRKGTFGKAVYGEFGVSRGLAEEAQ